MGHGRIVCTNNCGQISIKPGEKNEKTYLQAASFCCFRVCTKRCWWRRFPTLNLLKSIQKWLHNIFWKNMVLVDYIRIFFYISQYFWQMTIYIFFKYLYIFFIFILNFIAMPRKKLHEFCSWFIKRIHNFCLLNS